MLGGCPVRAAARAGSVFALMVAACSDGTITTGTSSVDAAPGDPDPDASPPPDPVPSLEEVDLGAVPIGSTLAFDIPDRTLGMSVLAAHASDSTAFGIYALLSPDGTHAIREFAIADGPEVFVDRGLVGAAVPQTDLVLAADPLAPGSWSISFADETGSSEMVGVRLWLRRSTDGAFHGGAVDVNLFVAPGAPGQPYLDEVLAVAFDGRFGGLVLGSVQLLATGADHAVVESRAELDQMLAESAGVGGEPALNVFVVTDLADGEFGGAIGVAGGIPGSPMRHGTAMSGIVVVAGGDPGQDASVLLHETGHLAGLFHTTEYQSDARDPISDTPECPAATIQSDPTACPDVANLMFAAAYGGTTLSAAQLRVIRGSALYRASASQSATATVDAPSSAGPPLPARTVAHVGWCGTNRP